MQNFLVLNKNQYLITKINLNFYYKQYMYFVIHNKYIINLKHFELKLNILYKLVKMLLLSNGRVGFIAYDIILKNKIKTYSNKLKTKLKKYLNSLFVNNFFEIKFFKTLKSCITIYHNYRGGYFTTNFYIFKKKLSDIFIIGDLSSNLYYIVNELFILRKPVISFIRFDFKNIVKVLYKIFGNYKNADVLAFYKKIIYYFMFKSLIYKKLYFYSNFIF